MCCKARVWLAFCPARNLFRLLHSSRQSMQPVLGACERRIQQKTSAAALPASCAPLVQHRARHSSLSLSEGLPRVPSLIQYHNLFNVSEELEACTLRRNFLKMEVLGSSGTSVRISQTTRLALHVFAHVVTFLSCIREVLSADTSTVLIGILWFSSCPPFKFQYSTSNSATLFSSFSI